MKNPVNRLATAAPRALDSLLQQQKKDSNKKNTNNNSKKERTCSFDLDLSGLNLLDNDGSSSVGGSSVAFSGGSIAEEGGSVVTFQELSEFISLNDDGGGGLSLDSWTNGSSTSVDVGSSNGMLSTNGSGGETPSPN